MKNDLTSQRFTGGRIARGTFTAFLTPALLFSCVPAQKKGDTARTKTEDGLTDGRTTRGFQNWAKEVVKDFKPEDILPETVLSEIEKKKKCKRQGNASIEYEERVPKLTLPTLKVSVVCAMESEPTILNLLSVTFIMEYRPNEDTALRMENFTIHNPLDPDGGLSKKADLDAQDFPEKDVQSIRDSFLGFLRKPGFKVLNSPASQDFIEALRLINLLQMRPLEGNDGPKLMEGLKENWYLARAQLPEEYRPANIEAYSRSMGNARENLKSAHTYANFVLTKSADAHKAKPLPKGVTALLLNAKEELRGMVQPDLVPAVVYALPLDKDSPGRASFFSWRMLKEKPLSPLFFTRSLEPQ